MFGIFDLLNNILPSTDRSNHDTLRLGYLSACKIMENEHYIMKILPHIPKSIFDLLLQSSIYKCYLDFINIEKKSIENIDDIIDHLYKRDIVFPDTLWILILNWPHNELVLRTKLHSVNPPVDIFQNNHGPVGKQNQSICQVEDLKSVFVNFCNRMVQFIIQAVLKCSPRNTPGFSGNIRMLDLSGLEDFSDFELEEILEGIRNSTIDTFGHKIEIVIDANVNMRGGFKVLKNISEENLKPDLGIAVHFNNIDITASSAKLLSTDFYNVLVLARCEYIQLKGLDFIDRSLGENLCTHLPQLVGLGIPFQKNIESLDFLSAFENIEQLSLQWNKNKGLVNSISNMSKGLKYLNLSFCKLHNNDLECLANSMHSNTLLELHLSGNRKAINSEAVGLINLCHKLNNVKVLTLDECSLDILSSNSVSNLVIAFKDCVTLEFLSMNLNPFCLVLTKIIIGGLSQNKSLRYLSLDLPEGQYDLCKTFHETINEYRSSPIYISWCLDE